MPDKTRRKPAKTADARPRLLSGGNPQIAKADGDAPVQAYIAAMPEWKSDLGRRLDDLIVRAVPNVRKAVRWNSPWYGIEGQGWFLSYHVFTRYVKVTFLNGAQLRPEPPGSGKDPDARWIDIYEDELDEAQMETWVRQSAAIPGLWVGAARVRHTVPTPPRLRYQSPPGSPPMPSQRARDLHSSALVVDTHADNLVWALDEGEDIADDLPHRQLTLPRMRAGGIDAQFMAAWVDPARFGPESYVRRTLGFIDAMHRACAAHPDQLELALTAADVRRIKAAGKLAAILCVEGGHSIDDDLAVLRTYHRLGVRYMTLTWNNTNNWADGLDEARHGGLNDLGRAVVREMDRLGMIVDVSHASAQTFWDALETASRPIMASHSCAAALCPHPRNLDDDQLRAIAQERRRRLRHLRPPVRVRPLQAPARGAESDRPRGAGGLHPGVR